MIREFFNEINKNTTFNAYLKRVMKFVQFGCISIYLIFIISAIFFPYYINITLWIVIISWFSLIILSTNSYIHEKESILTVKELKKKNEQVNNDIEYIKKMLKKYKLDDELKKIVKNFKNDEHQFSWFAFLLPITTIIIIISSLNVELKVIYIVIVGLFTYGMSLYTKFLNTDIHNLKSSNKQYIYFCLLAIDNERNSKIKKNAN